MRSTPSGNEVCRSEDMIPPGEAKSEGRLRESMAQKSIDTFLKFLLGYKIPVRERKFTA